MTYLEKKEHGYVRVSERSPCKDSFSLSGDTKKPCAPKANIISLHQRESIVESIVASKRQMKETGRSQVDGIIMASPRW